MKQHLILGFLAFTTTCFGQSFLPTQFDTTWSKHELIFSGDNELNATALQVGMSNRLLHGGQISSDMINQSYDSHANTNRIGKLLQANFEYRNFTVSLFKNPNWGYVVSGGYTVIGSAAYSKDLYGLLFKGNASYLNQTAEFSGSRFSLKNFQKIGFGIISKKNKSSVVLNLVNVSNYYQGIVRTGILTQNEDASQIGLHLDGTFSYANPNQFSNGVGACVDLDFKFPFQWINKQAHIQFQAKNLGIAYMNQGIRSYLSDSTYSYSGFTFDQLFANQSVVSNQFSVLDSLHITTENIKKWIVLPCVIQVGKMVEENRTGKWQSFFGVRLYPNLASVPLLYIGFDYKPKAIVNLGASILYGGFGGLRAGFYASANLSKWNIGLGTENVIGAISPKGYGQTLNIRLRCNL
jgi:hypothetical protein